MLSEVLLTDKIERWIHSVLETESLPGELRSKLKTATTNQKSADNHAHRTILFSLVCNVHHYMKKQEGREGLNDFPYVYVLCGGGLELYHCLYPGMFVRCD